LANLVLALFEPCRYQQKLCAAFKIVEKDVKKLLRKFSWPNFFDKVTKIKKAMSLLFYVHTFFKLFIGF
jgi:hypothetical protein